MKTIPRQIENDALETARQFRAVCIVGPRQSGKTTLSKMVFGQKPYVNLENPGTQAAALEDTESFLNQYPKGAILDEVQRVPDIFRYLQGMLDKSQQRGQFILTGSNNFLLQEQISQSLAGRVGYLELLPLSYAELSDAHLAADQPNKHILTGGYPELLGSKHWPDKWMSSYLQTYVQRDVRLIRNITNLAAFNRFIYLCAGYAGQILNKDALGRNVGVDAKTIQSWLQVLESSYIIYQLQPHYQNLNKRIIKSPKLYFYDTGLLCYLLGIHSEASLMKHPAYGALFENWTMTEIRKNRYNQGLSGGMYYFRDSAGNEVDLILEKQDEILAIEIKSSKKINSEMLSGIRYWQRYKPNDHGILLFGGSTGKEMNDQVNALSWKEVAYV